MIFTIGRYDDSIFENNPLKMGRAEDYPGGSVWKSKEEAEKHLQEGYKVYGVMADWETETEPSQDGDWNDLLVDAPLVKLEG